MRVFLRSVFLSLVTCMVMMPAYASVDLSTTTEQDDAFLELREAARKPDPALVNSLAGELAGYPVPSYVEYYRLRTRIETATEAEILGFIERYRNSAIADRLRNDWLLVLARRGHWATFDREYPLFQLKDDFQLKCYELVSAANRGENVAARARILLDVPRRNNEGCFTLVSVLSKNGQFTSDDTWFQVRTAAEGSPARFVGRLGGIAGAQPTEMSKALEMPAATLSRGPGQSRASREAFILALGQTAKKNHKKAAEALKKAKGNLSQKEQAAAWAQIALPVSLLLSPDALGFWKKAEGAPLSGHAQAWRARMALRALDWKALDKWIDEMPQHLKNDETWVYWKGRAQQQFGNTEKARRLYASIAGQMNFYGQLALEELGGKITAPRAAAPVTEREVAAMAGNPGFLLSLKFFTLNLRFEAIREWNWQLRGMTDRQLLAAAEFARRNGHLDRMINTSDRTKEEFLFSQRFPMPFKDNMKEATQKLALDVNWIYGLIRQESRFIMDARSSAGASGLMQLMPATAKIVARQIGFTEYSPKEINSLETNILLGTTYMRMMMDTFSQSEPLASAAYNAGPGRPRAWRQRLTRAVEGAIFAETIPFSETRDYVKKVMSNAVYYAAYTEGRPQSLKARMGRVAPP